MKAIKHTIFGQCVCEIPPLPIGNGDMPYRFFECMIQEFACYMRYHLLLLDNLSEPCFYANEYVFQSYGRGSQFLVVHL